MDEWWPRLDEGVLAHLQRVFQTPLKLDAAFDNDEECLMMLNAEFPDMVAEDAMDSMAILVSVEGGHGQAVEACTWGAREVFHCIGYHSLANSQCKRSLQGSHVQVPSAFWRCM